VRRRTAGFTIVEALIVVAVGSMVLMVIMGLLNFATKSFGRTANRLDPRESATKVMMTLRKHLMDVQFYKVADQGQELFFKAPYEHGRLAFDPARGAITLKFSHQGARRDEVIAYGVTDFSIHQMTRGLLRVTVVCDRPEVKDGLAPLGALHAVEEIACPAAARTRMVPWNRTEDFKRGRRRGGPPVPIQS
jgi:hypothetical protein